MLEDKDELKTRIDELDKKLEIIHQLLISKEKSSELNTPSKTTHKFENDQLLYQAKTIAMPFSNIQVNEKIIYPGTKIYRGFVPETKKSWDVNYQNYLPVKYTSKEVLLNTSSDFDLLNKYKIKFKFFLLT
jgi:hypothetical protein